MTYLDAEQARRVYDRIGRLQDTQRFYENPALDVLVTRGRFGDAHAVVEVGCGTGTLAARLLGRELPADAQLVGVDLSPRMAALARGRVAGFGGRAGIELGDAAERIPVADGWADRVVSAYVLDLLPPERAAAVVAEAARALAPGGLLCLASLTTGHGAAARLLASAWSRLWALRPQLVGGCRPSDLLPLLAGPAWHVESAEVVTTLAVGSQVVIARRTE
ncbi:MAG TPA: class I SAM-dependent methyltransferase [Gaiellaceae bacterium]|nr:class I SAM-dependent methyltransferase [Gaiellaceae bacterium]